MRTSAAIVCIVTLGCSESPRPRATVETPETAVKRFATAPMTLVSYPEAIPAEVLRVFQENLPEALAMPGERFNATDVFWEGLPRRRLFAAGHDDRLWFLSYEHGGRAPHHHLALVTARDPPRLVFAKAFYLGVVTTLGELQSAVGAQDLSPPDPGGHVW